MAYLLEKQQRRKKTKEHQQKKKEHKKRNEVKLDDVTMQPVSFVIVGVRLRYTQGTFFFSFFFHAGKAAFERANGGASCRTIFPPTTATRRKKSLAELRSRN